MSISSPRSIDGRAAGLMVLLCLCWALQQILVKAVAADISPMLQIGLRSAMAAALVLLLMRVQGLQVHWRRHWRGALAVGLLFGGEYVMVAEALRRTSAAHTVVFLYTAPIFAALGLHLRVPTERLRPLQGLGIALAFGGVALAFLGEPAAAGADGATDRIGDLLALGGGLAWGATTVVLRGSSLARAPASESLLYQLTGAAVLLLGAALLTGQTAVHWTPAVLGGLAFQTVVVAFASFLVWFWLLRHYAAAMLGVFTFLTPIFGVTLGAWLLDEALAPSFVRGALLVLAGVVMVSAEGPLRAWLSRRGGRRQAAGGAGLG